MRLLKDPLVLFLALGAFIFVAYAFSPAARSTEAERRIVVDRATQEWLYANFEKQFRRPPSRAEMRALVQSHIEQEIKYREALAMGLDERDSIVRRRMMQKFDFLFGGAAVDAVPEEAVLRRWYDENPDDFTRQATVSFTHLWFNPDLRGDANASAVSAALASLQSGGDAKGDPFPYDAAFDGATYAEVRNVMGPEFADAVFALPLNEWSGPVASGLGEHIVRVTRRVESKVPPFEDVRDAVLERWQEIQSDRVLAEMIEALKNVYDVAIDESTLEQFSYAPDAVGHAP